MPRYFDFEVSLCEVTPRIWRRFLIQSTARFSDLHLAIQGACGWRNYHLYAFRDEPTWETGHDIAGLPDAEGFEDDPPVPDSMKVKLSSYFGEGKEHTCFYLYDFGDDWWHEVRLKGTRTLPEKFHRRLLGGARAFPHEDSGGLPGYEDCVKAALGQDKCIDDPDGLRTWMGEWHPERFDLAAVKRLGARVADSGRRRLFDHGGYSSITLRRLEIAATLDKSPAPWYSASDAPPAR